MGQKKKKQIRGVFTMNLFGVRSSFVWVLVIFLHAAVTPLEAAGMGKFMNKNEKEFLKDITKGKIEMKGELGLFVHYKNRKGRKYAAHRGKQGKREKYFPHGHTLTVRATNVTALKELLTNKAIDYVEPIHPIRPLPIPRNVFTQSSLRGGDQRMLNTDGSPGYGVTMVQAPQLWDITPKSMITVCVIDTGYAIDHPDLPDLSHNVTGSSTHSSSWDTDVFSHGTHCAGIIGAIGDNNQGTVGVLKDPNSLGFHIAKSISNEGVGDESDLLDALESCIDNGAKVVSMSVGGEGGSETVRAAFERAYDQDILLLSAAGNDGNSVYNYPSAYPHVMSVAAVDQDMKPAGFSQENDQVEIAGPGVGIWSTITTQNGTSFEYGAKSGTSMSTPYVAGVAALVWSHFPECSNNQIRNVLVRTAYDPEGNGCNQKLGFGIVQAKAAYDLLNSQGCTAGDKSPAPLSDGAVGGCKQDPSYVPPVKFTPSSYECDGNVFLLELQTDFYGIETVWEVRNSSDQVVGSGGPYDISMKYVERLCLPFDEYKFTIKDAASDGLCCNFGKGGYSVYYKDRLVTSGGEFGAEETTTFGCQDDDQWVFTTWAGRKKYCGYVANKPDRRCPKVGVDRFGKDATGWEACPYSCNLCPKSTVT